MEQDGPGEPSAQGSGIAVDAHGAADASIDELAIGEADVRLVRGHAGAVQPLPQRRSLLRVSQIHAADAGAVERAELGRHEPRA